jgi:MFS family permease
MIASLVLLGFAFIGAIPSLGIVAVLSLMCYVAFFAISLGPVAWLIISEIYPLEVRGKAMSIATFANWGCNFIVSLTFLSLIEWLGSAGAFWLYAAIAMLALWFVMVKVPETKGQTLSKIQEFWKKHYSK